MITFYALSYTQEILNVRIKQLFPIFASAISSRVAPLLKEAFARGMVLTLINDEHNQGQCRSSFLLNQGLDIPIRLTVHVNPSVVNANVPSEDTDDDEPKLKPVVDPSAKIMLMSPKRVRETIETVAQAEGSAFGMFQDTVRDAVTSLVGKLYQENFVFAEVDVENAQALRTLFSYSDEVDLNVRVKAAAPQKA